MEGKEAPYPKEVKPMLAKLVEKPLLNNEYVYEVKWDAPLSVRPSNAYENDRTDTNFKY